MLEIHVMEEVKGPKREQKRNFNLNTWTAENQNLKRFWKKILREKGYTIVYVNISFIQLIITSKYLQRKNTKIWIFQMRKENQLTVSRHSCYLYFLNDILLLSSIFEFDRWNGIQYSFLQILFFKFKGLLMAGSVFF